jgi:hypothetical protein
MRSTLRRAYGGGNGRAAGLVLSLTGGTARVNVPVLAAGLFDRVTTESSKRNPAAAAARSKLGCAVVLFHPLG